MSETMKWKMRFLVGGTAIFFLFGLSMKTFAAEEKTALVIETEVFSEMHRAKYVSLIENELRKQQAEHGDGALNGALSTTGQCVIFYEAKRNYLRSKEIDGAPLERLRMAMTFYFITTSEAVGTIVGDPVLTDTVIASYNAGHSQAYMEWFNTINVGEATGDSKQYTDTTELCTKRSTEYDGFWKYAKTLVDDNEVQAEKAKRLQAQSQ